MEKLLPQLRFPDFESSLTALKLDDVVTFKSGGTPPKENESYWNGDIPWISAASMQGKYYSKSDRTITEEGLKKGSKLAIKGSLLILVRGSMLFNKIPLGITERDVAFNQDLKSLLVNNRSNTEYLYQWFSSKENLILDKVGGTGIGAGKLDTDDLKNLKLYLPSLPEQTKIATFLTAVDEKLTALKQKKILLEQYKKGVMQQIFSQELRFKDYTSTSLSTGSGNDYADWEEKKLVEVAEKRIIKNKDNKINLVFTNSAVQGIVNQRDFFDKDIANKNNLTGYYLIEKNDFVYNPRISSTAPVGPISRNHLDTGIMSPLYSVFRFKDGNLDFIEKFFGSIIWHKHMEDISNYGARDDRMSFSSKDFYTMPIPFPSLIEQTKIANFLAAIDEKINHCQLQIEKAGIWKKGLLQQLFV
jgi:type I restriction enzyme S subunit